MSLTAQERNQAVEDLLVWLPTADLDDVLFYAERFPKNSDLDWQDLTGELFTRLLIQRRQLLTQYFSPDLHKMLQQDSLMQLIALCQYYAPASVLHSFQTENPAVAALQPLQDPHQACTGFMLLWRKAVFFAASRQVVKEYSYVQAYLATQPTIERTELLIQQSDELIDQLDSILAGDVVNLIDVKAQLVNFFTEYQVVPNLTYDVLLEDKEWEEIQLQLQHANLSVKVVLSGLEQGVPVGSALAYRAILWSVLSDQVELDIMADSVAEDVLKAEDPVVTQRRENYKEYAAQLFTRRFVESGQTAATIKEQLAARIGADQEEFKNSLVLCFLGNILASSVLAAGEYGVETVVNALKYAEKQGAYDSVSYELLAGVPEYDKKVAQELITIIQLLF